MDGTKPLAITCYTDSDWAGDKIDLVSVTGTALKFDLEALYEDFAARLSGATVRPWTRVLDFCSIEAKEGESVLDFVARYLQLSRTVKLEEAAAGYFFLALPVKTRRLLTSYAGDWPLDLFDMTKLVVDLVNREAAVGDASSVSFQPQSSVRQSTFVRRCYECGDPNHLVAYCPKNRAALQSGSKQAEPVAKMDIKEAAVYSVVRLRSGNRRNDSRRPRLTVAQRNVVGNPTLCGTYVS